MYFCLIKPCFFNFFKKHCQVNLMTEIKLLQITLLYVTIMVIAGDFGIIEYNQLFSYNYTVILFHDFLHVYF